MASVTMRDYMIRKQELPRLAAGHAPSNGFARPADLAPMHLRLVTGFFSSRLQTKSLEEQIDDQVTLGRGRRRRKRRWSCLALSAWRLARRGVPSPGLAPGRSGGPDRCR